MRPRSLRATRAGWCLIAIIFGVGFAALNTGNNLLYLVLSLMLAFLVLSGLLSEASLRGIRVERRVPREIFAGGSNRVTLRISNTLRRFASFAISIEDTARRTDDLVSVGRSFALRVGPGERVDRSYLFEPDRRGEWFFEHIAVSTRFPFGLFVKSVELEEFETVLVYPDIARPAPEPPESDGDHRPEFDQGHRAGGEDIAGLREFIPGDSYRRVHWRRSLRTGRLLVGEREGQSSGEIEWELHLPRSAPRSVVEDRIAEAAAAVVHALATGRSVGLRTPQIRFAPADGFAHRTDLLRFLAQVEPDQLTEARTPNDAPAARGSDDLLGTPPVLGGALGAANLAQREPADRGEPIDGAELPS